jgi:hypothetical protein
VRSKSCSNTNLFPIQFVRFTIACEDDYNPQNAWLRLELNLKGFISTETNVLTAYMNNIQHVYRQITTSICTTVLDISQQTFLLSWKFSWGFSHFLSRIFLPTLEIYTRTCQILCNSLLSTIQLLMCEFHLNNILRTTFCSCLTKYLHLYYKVQTLMPFRGGGRKTIYCENFTKHTGVNIVREKRGF